MTPVGSNGKWRKQLLATADAGLVNDFVEGKCSWPAAQTCSLGRKGRSIGLQFMIIDILRSLHEKRTILPWFVGFLVVVGEIFAWLNRSAGLRRVFYRSLFFGLAVLALGTVVVDNRG